MGKIYRYKTRNIVEFSDKTRASFSAKRYGELLEMVTIQSHEADHKIFNPIEIEGEIVKIYYYDQLHDKVIFTLVDKEDYFRLNLWDKYWHFHDDKTLDSGSKYAKHREDDCKTIYYIHRMVMNFTEEDYKNNYVVDHINHNHLDNRKSNLRIVSIRQNSTNQTNQTNMGVSKTQDKKGWRARAVINKKEYSKSFYGENAYEEAKKYREQIAKECGYLCYIDLENDKNN